jgi:hypothetical protein
MIILSLAGLSLTELSLAGNNLIFPGQGEFDILYDIPAGDGKIDYLFLQCMAAHHNSIML